MSSYQVETMRPFVIRTHRTEWETERIIYRRESGDIVPYPVYTRVVTKIKDYSDNLDPCFEIVSKQTERRNTSE